MVLFGVFAGGLLSIRPGRLRQDDADPARGLFWLVFFVLAEGIQRFFLFCFPLEEFDIVFNFLNTSAARVRKMRHSVEKIIISPRFLGKIGSQAYFFVLAEGK